MRTYLQLDGAIFLALTADRERKGQLVPVLIRITAEPESAYERFEALASYTLMVYEIACVASVSVWCLSKKRPWKGIFGFDRARNETRTKKGKRGEGKGKERNLPFFPNPSPLFYLRHFSLGL